MARLLRRLVTGDPTDGSVMIFLALNTFELAEFAKGIGLGVYGARRYRSTWPTDNISLTISSVTLAQDPPCDLCPCE